MTALAIVIFNHILSRISRPESGSCITLTMVAMSVLLADRGRSSNSGGRKKSDCGKRHIRSKQCVNATGQPQRGCWFIAKWQRWAFLVHTIVWVGSRQGGGVRNPSSRVDGSHWFSWVEAETRKASSIINSWISWQWCSPRQKYSLRVFGVLYCKYCKFDCIIWQVGHCNHKGAPKLTFYMLSWQWLTSVLNLHM